LSYITHEEGHLEPSGAYKYYLKDHLGSVRLVVNTTGTGGTIEQQTDYYPFGMTIAEYNGSVIDYRYNGKELQDDLINTKKLDWYDYGARFYDPQIGRFHTIDPMAEDFPSWAPYHYVHNNPIVLVDPSGMSATKYEDEDKNLLLETNDGSDAVVTVTNDKRAGFDAAVKGTKNTDDVAWNNSMKEYALGFELSDKQESLLSSMNSDWSRRAAINYWKTDDAGAGIGFAFKEALSQWTNPELVATGLIAGMVGYTSMLGSATASSTALATKYPANASIPGTSQRVFLRPGQVIDRYGSLGGKWFSNPSVSYGARSIPPGQAPYTQFNVLKPFEVNKSIASPGAFSGQTGFGVQYETAVGANILIKRGIITPTR
jgi:RHS repeat-associated protein